MLCCADIPNSPSFFRFFGFGACGGRWAPYNRYFSYPGKILDNIAQHDRIIEDVLYSRQHFALFGKILQFRKPTILSFDRISILCGITAFEQKFDQRKNYTFEMMFAKVPPYLKLSHTELKFRP